MTISPELQGLADEAADNPTAETCGEFLAEYCIEKYDAYDEDEEQIERLRRLLLDGADPLEAADLAISGADLDAPIEEDDEE